MTAESTDIRLLTEIGFLAGGSGDLKRARRIFTALAMLRPDRAFPYIGDAVALLNAGQASEAVTLLGEIQSKLSNASESDMVRAFLGLALQLDNRPSQSVRVLRELIEESGAEDSEGRQLARRFLGEQGDTTMATSVPHSKNIRD